MPLPFLLLGAAIAAAGYGVKKGFDAKEDFDTAERVNNKARRVYDSSCEDLTEARKGAQKTLEKLGEKKFAVYRDSLIPFVSTFSKIRNIDYNDSIIKDGDLKGLRAEDLLEMRQSTAAMQEIVTGGLASLGAGGLAGLAAYGGVALLGTASTGAAIGGLSGVAATNATLAWLGGGSLAAGGFGMAGGMAVLGGIVAGPVLAIGGMMMASKAEAAKEDAYGNLSKAELASEQMKSATSVTNSIRQRFAEVYEVLYALNRHFERVQSDMSHLVSNSTDYKSYSNNQKRTVWVWAELARALKFMTEAPMLDKDGTLSSASMKVLRVGTLVNNALEGPAEDHTNALKRIAY